MIVLKATQDKVLSVLQSVAGIVNAMKGVSSRMLRKEFPLRPHAEHLWSPSYFAGSCGGAPITVIRQYIENQGKSPGRGRVESQCQGSMQPTPASAVARTLPTAGIVCE